MERLRIGGWIPSVLQDTDAGRQAGPIGEGGDDPDTTGASTLSADSPDRPGESPVPPKGRRRAAAPAGGRRSKNPGPARPPAPRFALVAGAAAVAVLGLVLVPYASLSQGTATRSTAPDVVVGAPWTPPQPSSSASATGLPPGTPAPSATTSAPPTRTTADHSRATARTRARPTTERRSPSSSPTPDRNPTEGYVSIVAPIGKCVDVVDGGKGDGDAVQQWSCHGGDNQLWRFTPGDAGHYVIVSRNSGKCLDVHGGDRGDGARVQQWSCNGGANQQWRSEPDDGGYHRLVNRNSGKCLDVYGGDHGDGARIVQWSCNGGSNQQFAARPSR